MAGREPPISLIGWHYLHPLVLSSFKTITSMASQIRHACLRLASSFSETSFLIPIQSALVALFYPHTPNFAWVHVIWPHNELLEYSHLELFTQILIPTFRPFLHLEKLLGTLLGSKGIDTINQVCYAVFVWLIADLCRKAVLGLKLQQCGLMSA